MKTDILKQNESSWNALADDFFGVTALPVLGCSIPTEDELHLFPDLNGKAVFEMGCGSGHSLKWCAEHGATELYGLDISEQQLNTAKKLLEDGLKISVKFNGDFPYHEDYYDENGMLIEKLQESWNYDIDDWEFDGDEVEVVG